MHVSNVTTKPAAPATTNYTQYNGEFIFRDRRPPVIVEGSANFARAIQRVEQMTMGEHVSAGRATKVTPSAAAGDGPGRNGSVGGSGAVVKQAAAAAAGAPSQPGSVAGPAPPRIMGGVDPGVSTTAGPRPGSVESGSPK